MDIQNFIAEFKKTFIYDMLCESLEDEQLFEHTIVGNKVIWMKEQTRQMWSMWQVAKANAVPKGYKLVKKPKLLIGNEKVDFSQAPKWANFWLKDGYSKRCIWSNKRPKIDLDIGCFIFPFNYQAIEAPNFGFDGDWTKSLTGRKAMIEAQEQANER